MSFTDTISRVGELEIMLVPQLPVQLASTGVSAAPAQTSQVSPTTFASELEQAMSSSDETSDTSSAGTDFASQLALLSGLGGGSSSLGGQLYTDGLDATPAPTAPAAGVAGSNASVAAVAEGELAKNVVETSPNEAPEIDLYHTAVAGAQPGDAWCAEFASWCSAQAGTPLGFNGEGFRSVSDLTNWAAQTGRLLPASATPQPGDLMLFGTQHVGIVDHVDPDGTIHTIEGNYANAVSAVTRNPSEATGFVRVG